MNYPVWSQFDQSLRILLVIMLI